VAAFASATVLCQLRPGRLRAAP